MDNVLHPRERATVHLYDGHIVSYSNIVRLAIDNGNLHLYRLWWGPFTRHAAFHPDGEWREVTITSA